LKEEEEDDDDDDDDDDIGLIRNLLLSNKLWRMKMRWKDYVTMSFKERILPLGDETY
jgi:hypothetical protein